MESSYKKDIFIAHASEDKDAVAVPLRDFFVRRGFSVWIDKHEVYVGDPLRETIEEALGSAQFGIIILSEAFFAPNKTWTHHELKTLRGQLAGDRKLLLIRHGISVDRVDHFVPELAETFSTYTDDGIELAGSKILEAIFHQRGLPLPSFVSLDDQGRAGLPSMHRALCEFLTDESAIQLIWPDRVRNGLRLVESACESAFPGSDGPLDAIRLKSGRVLTTYDFNWLTSAPARLRRVIERTNERIPMLIKGYRAYASDHHPIYMRTLRIFLELAYQSVWNEVDALVAALGGQGRNDPSSFVDQLRAATNRSGDYLRANVALLSYQHQKRFISFEEALSLPPDNANLLDFAGLNNGFTIWAPREYWPRGMRTNLYVGSEFFEEFLIPQIELRLVREKFSSPLSYLPETDAWRITGLKDEADNHVAFWD